MTYMVYIVRQIMHVRYSSHNKTWPIRGSSYSSGVIDDHFVHIWPFRTVKNLALNRISTTQKAMKNPVDPAIIGSTLDVYDVYFIILAILCSKLHKRNTIFSG